MKEILDAVLTLVITVVIGSYGGHKLYNFVRHEVIVKVQQGPMSLTNLTEKLTGKKSDF